LNVHGTDSTEKFVGVVRFLSCVSGPKCLKYQTKTIGAIRTAITTIAQIRFARFTKRSYISLKKTKQCPDEKQSAEGECAPGSIGSAPYVICIACQRLAGPHCARLYCARRPGSPVSPEDISRAQVIDRETNVTPPQFGVRRAGSQCSMGEHDKFKFTFKFGSIVSAN
jgi:hypothetical protein